MLDIVQLAKLTIVHFKIRDTDCDMWAMDVFSLEMDSLNNEDDFLGQFTGLADI